MEDATIIEKSFSRNHDFIKKQIDNNPFMRYLDDELGVQAGFEIEFYLKDGSGLDPNESIRYMLMQGMSVLADKAKLVLIGKERKKEDGAWYIERDPTLDSSDFGFELVSPVMPIRELAFYLKGAFSLIQSVGGYTNEDCGFHLHVSAKNMAKIDFIKLLAFVDASGLLKDYENRNEYVKSLLPIFKQNNPALLAENTFKMGRFYNIIRVDAKNHVEFRALGGTDYEKDPVMILNKLEIFLKSYAVACSPKWCVSEYETLMRKHEENRLKHYGDQPVVTIDEVLAVGLEIAQTTTRQEILDDEDVIFLISDIALSLLEEHRIAPREDIANEIESVLGPNQNPDNKIANAVKEILARVEQRKQELQPQWAKIG